MNGTPSKKYSSLRSQRKNSNASDRTYLPEEDILPLMQFSKRRTSPSPEYVSYIFSEKY